jgi:orotidine-5'-phosphate decarboxylase
MEDSNGNSLYLQVIEKMKTWGEIDNLMFVVGATKASKLEEIRKIVPEHFLLVPGVGAQGGSLKEVFDFGATKDCGLLVNASRSIIYAGKEEEFESEAKKEALKIQSEMALYLQRLAF